MSVCSYCVSQQPAPTCHGERTHVTSDFRGRCWRARLRESWRPTRAVLTVHRSLVLTQEGWTGCLVPRHYLHIRVGITWENGRALTEAEAGDRRGRCWNRYGRRLLGQVEGAEEEWQNQGVKWRQLFQQGRAMLVLESLLGDSCGSALGGSQTR